jgi:zinc and cadmium transporter
MVLLQILLATTLVSLVSVIGILLFAIRGNVQNITFYLISLASGTMLGGAFLHLIPEAAEYQLPNLYLLIALGVFIFFIFEKFLIWRHCHTHEHTHGREASRPAAASMMLAADSVHNFIDGIIIASAYLSSPSLGVSVTLAILLHEIPQELGDSAILMHAGFSPKKILLANGLTALTAILGGVLTYFFLHAVPLLQPYLLAVTAGGFLYIALADLIPQLHEQVALHHTLAQIALLGGGFLTMLLLKSVVR